MLFTGIDTLSTIFINMKYTSLRHLIRAIILEKKRLITEPEEVSEEEEKNEFSGGGVAGAPAVGHRPRKNKKK